jgi:hypothetical protein
MLVKGKLPDMLKMFAEGAVQIGQDVVNDPVLGPCLLIPEEWLEDDDEAGNAPK